MKLGVQVAKGCHFHVVKTEWWCVESFWDSTGTLQTTDVILMPYSQPIDRRLAKNCILYLKLTTDRHAASRGLFATAELLVFETAQAGCINSVWSKLFHLSMSIWEKYFLISVLNHILQIFWLWPREPLSIPSSAWIKPVGHYVYLCVIVKHFKHFGLNLY